MDTHYPPTEVPATPEYVLEVLRDCHRQEREHCGFVDRDFWLTFESTVDEWDFACELLGWNRIGRWLNGFWGINVSEAEWKATLHPLKERRVRGVCDLIARHARRPVVPPLQVLGKACQPAGMFLAIRSCLQRAGANVEGIAPSTELGPYAREFGGAIFEASCLWTPGVLPPVRVTPVKHPKIRRLFYTGVILMVLGFALGLPTIKIGGFVLLVAMLALRLRFIVWGTEIPEAVEFGDIRTFRDLAVVLAEGAKA
jgi:hypothetical protein